MVQLGVPASVDACVAHYLTDGRATLVVQKHLPCRYPTEIRVQQTVCAGLLEGASLLQRVAEGGRMYIMDFYTHFVDYLHRVNGLPGPIPRVAYAGRCILYSRY